MLHAAEHFEMESELALQAAERAITLQERISHLEAANRYAQLACAERKRSSIYDFSSAPKR